MQEWHELSSRNKLGSDKKYDESQEIAKQLNSMTHEII
jgi:hypothetical protein